jgi:hypothetical protein
MKNIMIVLLIGFAMSITACAPLQPRPEEIAVGQRAIRPSSNEAAQRAVIEYFSTQLKDPQSAQYRYRDIINSKLLLASDFRLFGWFMCGTVNAKNSFGGYSGSSTFFAYFDPNKSNSVAVGNFDSGQYNIVADWCKQIYGY